MITWSEFVMLVNSKISESNISSKEPEVKFIHISLAAGIEEINVTINKDNQLEIS